MAFGTYNDRPPGWPAWGISLLVHSGLLLAIVLGLQNPPPVGIAQEPSREVGIALKHSTESGPRFETEGEAAETEQSKNVASDAMLDALPNPSEFPSSSAALPELPTLGRGEPSLGAQGDVGQMAAGGAPSKRIGGETTVSVFGLQGTGTRFVYVFDRSISMAGPPLRTAKAELIGSLESLDSVHQFHVIFFNHEPQSWDLTAGQNRIAFATDANKRSAEKFIGGITATGGTFRRGALLRALALGPDAIFFLTDTDDPMSSADLREAIRRAQRDSIAIHTIEFSSADPGTGENFLVTLARATGGQYVYVDTRKLAR